VFSVVVLISGAGTNLDALLQAAHGDYPARIVAVGADRDAPGLAHARRRGLPTFTVPFREYPTREAWGDALLAAVRRHRPDLVVLSGLMRILPPSVVAALSPALINTHPAYLPEFPGAHAVRDALAAGVHETGASLIVVDDGVDTGRVLVRERVPVLPADTEESLHSRIKPVERRLLIQAVADIATGHLDLKEL
jgi:phosphoribosylglycinamide formyltransferase-1